jgi:tripartite-type tricarboxylate transporter receptor subunit TctC
MAGMSMLARRSLLAAAAAAPTAAPAQPQRWPVRPVRFVVPFAPGGPVEPPARLIAEHLTARLGQPVVVELKPGAAGAIGAREVAGATDGHSFLFTTGGLAVLPALQRDPGLDVLRDLAPVTVVADMPMAIVVRADSPIADLPGLVAAARARPGGLAYGSSGNGSTTHLAWLLLQARTGLELLHVPYRGAGMAVNALYAGEIGVYMGDLGLLLPHVADGRFRMLAVTSAARLPLLPGGPAVAEAVPGYAMSLWYCLLGPRGTPEEVVRRLMAEIAPLRDGSVLAQRVAANGGALPLDGPAPLAAKLREEMALWGEVLARAGIRPE